MSKYVVNIRFFDPEHGPGSRVDLFVSEKDAALISEFDEVETPLELPSLPGVMVIKQGGRIIFTVYRGGQARSYQCSQRELKECLNDPERRIYDNYYI